ncbi:MAG: DUF4838 domain-containing protein [Candidatus Omnitrophota bacterium]
MPIQAAENPQDKKPFFLTRGIVLTPEDFTWREWPQAAKKANLTTIGIHHQNSPAKIIQFIRSELGREILEQCQQLSLEVEYELHAMKELLPRDLFGANPEWFRMDEKGNRNPDSNLCVSSKAALGIAAENAAKIGAILRPTTHRYFYWGDDGQPWCHCPQCREFSDSDQALILENHILKALRSNDPKAKLAHLAYANSLIPPKKVKPEPGVFLEYAPINRRYDIPFESPGDKVQKENLDALDANLEFFGAENAQALEYWLDVSLFSKWKRPAVKLPFHPEVFESDIKTYYKRGIRNVASFAVYIDSEYVSKHGIPPLDEYGKRLLLSD